MAGNYSTDFMGSGTVEKEEDLDLGKAGTVKRWLTEIKLAEQENTRWFDRCRKIRRRYRDERTFQAEDWGSDSVDTRRFNILWSNIQTLGPSIYARTPKPQVERRFKDKDQLGRIASQILERATSFSCQEYDFDSVMQGARDDYLLFGRGQAWVRYVPHMEQQTRRVPLTVQTGKLFDPDGNPAGLAPNEVMQDDQGFYMQEQYQTVAYEEVLVEQVPWEDFLHNPARNWEVEVRWVSRKVYLTHAQIAERFGEKIADRVSYTELPKNLEINDEEIGPQHSMFKKACVYEIWDKDRREVVFITPGLKTQPLEVTPDPLGLSGFFPCPKPMLGTTTTDSLEPIPDFAQYQDQAKELDILTARIGKITQAIKVVAVAPASFEEAQRVFESSTDNDVVLVEGWHKFSEKGGLQQMMQYVPVREIAEVLMNLYQARDQVKAEIYELTGLADIIRGASNPNETATAQQIKGRFATLRLADKQMTMQNFARDIIAIKAEIIAEHFSAETLRLMAGADFIDSPDVMGAYQAAVQLLRNDKMRSFRVTVETDSTIAVDEDMEKEARVQFLQAHAPFIEKVTQAAQAMPELLPLAGEMLMFSTRGFKVGRNLEATMEQTLQALQQKAQQMQMQQQQMMQAQTQQAQQAAQAQHQVNQMQFQVKQQELGIKGQELQIRAGDLQIKAQEQAIKRAELGISQNKELAQIQIEQQKVSLDADKAYREFELEAIKMQKDQEIRTLEILQKGREKETMPSEDKPLMPNIVINTTDGKRKQTVARKLPDGSFVAETLDVDEGI